MMSESTKIASFGQNGQSQNRPDARQGRKPPHASLTDYCDG